MANHGTKAHRAALVSMLTRAMAKREQWPWLSHDDLIYCNMDI